MYFLVSDFSQCTINVRILQEPPDGVPEALPVGGDIALTLGLAHSNLVYSLERFIFRHAVGETVRLKAALSASSSDLDFGTENIKMISDEEWCMDSQNGSPDYRNGAASSHADENAIVFEVSLKDLNKAALITEIDNREKFRRASCLKDVGTECFKEGKVDLAFSHYCRALKYCICIERVEPCDEDFNAKVDKLTSQCYFNMAACHMQRENYEYVIYCCTKGLLLDPTNIKGLFRRSQAYAKEGYLEKGAEDAKSALTVEPQNKAIQSHYRNLLDRIKRSEANIAEGMKKFFS